MKDIAPVLFCIYNRLQCTKKTVQQIGKAQPKKLCYCTQMELCIKTKKDKINCLKTREWVLENIDWKCELTVFLVDKILIAKLP